MEPSYFTTNYSQAQPNETVSPYQYSPGTTPGAFMAHHASRHASQSVPVCSPPYGAAQYTPASSHHLPAPHMDLAPMGSRHPQYTVQPLSVSGMGSSGALPYHTHRQDSMEVARRTTVPTTLVSHNELHTPRTQTSIGGGDVTDMFRANSNSGSAGEQAKSPKGRASIASTIPRELYNLCVTDGDHIDINERASADDRVLFNIHSQQRSTRGKGMWDNITSHYLKVGEDKTPSTPRLQMKYVRCFRKHFMLPKDLYKILMDVYEEDERNRYTRITKTFKEASGLVHDNVKTAEIEAFLVRLGLENPSQDETTKVRRRRRSAAAKREQRNASMQNRNHSPPGMVWNNSYGQMGANGNQQYALPGTGQHQHQPGHASQGFDFANGLSVSQEDNLMTELEMKYNTSPDAPTYDSPGASTPGSDPHETMNPMLSAGADMNGHSRALPALPLYPPMDRSGMNTPNIKHEAWR